MLIKEWDIDHVSMIDVDQVNRDSVIKALYSSVGGVVFVTDNMHLYGYYSVDMMKDLCKEKENIFAKCNRNCPQIRRGDNWKTSVANVISKNIYAGMIALVDDTGKLTGALSATDETWLSDRESALTSLLFYGSHNIDISEYFKNENIHKIALWGIDDLSLSLGSILMNCDCIDSVTVYDNQLTNVNNRCNLLNYSVNVEYVDTITAIRDVDLLIVSDWRFRHVVCPEGIRRVVYYNKLLKDNKFKSAVNRAFVSELRNHGQTIFTVRIPTADDLGIEIKKELTHEDRMKWFAKETGFGVRSEQLRCFNNERQKLAKNERRSSELSYFGDFAGRYVNYLNKHRIVLNSPRKYDNTIYVVGPCMVSGLFNKDDNTLGYYLQEKVPDQYRVIPIGIPNDADRYWYYKMIDSLDLKQGDRVYWIEQTFRFLEWDLDLKPEFEKAYKLLGHDFYYDMPAHCGKDVLEMCASAIAEHVVNVKAESVSHTEENKPKTGGTVKKEENYAGLEKYKQFIASQAIYERPKIGSIVMNCNPFTLGHQYLIEYAANMMDYLYVFVVEENKSFFEFEDRIELVKQGTQHLKNVQVLPSGEFIISSNTFSEYFEKANLKGTTIDPSYDVELFASQIAPVLGITYRFGGEEPLDPITKQYNDTMKDLLPKYGMSFIEIPRKEDEGEGIISASLVRKMLSENNWEVIEKIVPATTLDYLERKFKNQPNN